MKKESVDPERCALSWCITNADLTPLIAAELHMPVDEDHPNQFEDKEHSGILDWALGHYREFGKSPGLDALRLYDPNYRLVETTEHIDVYIADIKRRIRYLVLTDTIREASTLADRDEDDDAVAALTRGVLELNQVATSAYDEDITLNTTERFEYYDELRSNPGALQGWATGFHTIDRATGGIQHDHFVMLGGPQKSGKSTALMVMGKKFNEQGAKALLVSFEMSASEQKARWDAIWAKVNYRKLMDGRTSRKEMRQIRAAMQRMEDRFPFILTTDTARMTTVSGILAKVEKHKPDIVLVDGVYLMMDDYGETPGSPQAITNILRDFRRMTQQVCPVIGTTQTSEAKTTRRRGVTTGSFSWSQSFGQETTTLIGLQPADEEEETEAEIRVLESRHGPKVRATLIWDWDTMTFEEAWGDNGYDDSQQTSAQGGY